MADCTANFRDQTLKYQRCETVHSNVSVHWSVQNETLDTLLTGKLTDGWVGLGWGYLKMADSNSVIAYRSANGTVNAGDYDTSTKLSSAVQPAGRQNLDFLDVHATADTVSARFIRTLASPGNNVPAINRAGLNPFIWAYGPKSPSATSLNKHIMRGGRVVNFATPEKRSTEVNSFGSFFEAHGVMMALSWLFFIPVAVIFMRFFKKLNPITFQIHRAFNGFAVLLGVIAYIMGLSRGSHTQVAHLAMGSIAMILAAVQIFTGFVRPQTGGRIRKLWFLFHAYPGRIALGLGILNCYFGLYIYGVPWYWYFIVSIIVASFCTVVVVFSLIPSKFPIVDEERRDLSHSVDDDFDSHDTG